MFGDSTKILHLADLHLGKEFSLENIVGDQFEIRREEIWRTFENSLEYGVSTGVSIVLLAGDNYENESITITELERLAHIFTKYKDLEFYVVYGNHDHISENSRYLESIAPENVHFFKDQLEYVQEKNLRIYGFSWDRLEYRSVPFEIPELDRDYFNILLIHGTNSTESDYLPLDIKELERQGFDYIALGHIHRPGQVGEKSFYPGCIEPMSFNNTDDHGGYILTIRRKSSKVEFVKFAIRNYHIKKYDLGEYSSTYECIDHIREDLEDVKSEDFLKIYLEGQYERTIDIEEIKSHLQLGYRNIKIIDNTRLKIDLETLIVENQHNIIGNYFYNVLENFQGAEQKELINIGINTLLEENFED